MTSKAVIIAGTHSGSGKTTVTLGIMAALSRLGQTVQPFKCGPDFIDPTLHKLVTGRDSRNLDLWMMGETFCIESFTNQQELADISVIEGVMGMYDGGDSSSAALAQKLNIPIILVLDVRSQAESAAAVVKGFESLAPNSVAGIILNRIGSPRHLKLVTNAIQKHCQAEILGYLPQNLAFSIPERHLGLHMGEEAPLCQDAVTELALAVQNHIDLEQLLHLGTLANDERSSLPEKSTPEIHLPKPPASGPIPKIGVAQDKAFCFYYEDNLDLLRAAGAELSFFSPLEDRTLPEGITALYLGGGYPELHADALSSNTKMLRDIKRWAENGGIIYAECGGFMYLTQGIITQDDQFHSMAGIFPVKSRVKKKLASLGYREIILKENCFLGPAGTLLRGHEFHYSAIDPMPSKISRTFAIDNDTEEGYRYKNTLGGYMHLHFGFYPQALFTLVKESVVQT